MGGGAGTFGQYEDEVRPPLPVIREALYDDSMPFGYASFPCLLFVRLTSFLCLLGVPVMNVFLLLILLFGLFDC